MTVCCRCMLLLPASTAPSPPTVNKNPLDSSTDHCSHLSSFHLSSFFPLLCHPSPTNSLLVYVLIFAARVISPLLLNLFLSQFVSLLSSFHVWLWEQPRGASIFPGQCSSRLEWRPLSLLFTASLTPQHCVHACVWARANAEWLQVFELQWGVSRGMWLPHFFRILRADLCF